MNARKHAHPSDDARRMLDALRRSVAMALERKQRLGYYSVIWRNGKPVVAGSDAPMDRADRG